MENLFGEDGVCEIWRVGLAKEPVGYMIIRYYPVRRHDEIKSLDL